jgi:Arc/MetJ family transcription regulator
MRTTLDIDEKLIKEVIRITGETNRSKAVTKVLEEFTLRNAIESLLQMQGNVDLDLEDWYEFRHMER